MKRKKAPEFSLVIARVRLVPAADLFPMADEAIHGLEKRTLWVRGRSTTVQLHPVFASQRILSHAKLAACVEMKCTTSNPSGKCLTMTHAAYSIFFFFSLAFLYIYNCKSPLRDSGFSVSRSAHSYKVSWLNRLTHASDTLDYCPIAAPLNPKS